jgi:hypothetical protein
MTAQVMKTEGYKDPRELSIGAQECCRLALEHAAAKTGLVADALKKRLKQGEEVCSEYFLYGWTKSMAPRIAALCPEVVAAYLLPADATDGDLQLRDMVIVTTRGSEALGVLCQGLTAQFDHIKQELGLRFSIAVHQVDSIEVLRGERVAAAINSANAPALQVWSSEAGQ